MSTQVLIAASQILSQIIIVQDRIATFEKELSNTMDKKVTKEYRRMIRPLKKQLLKLDACHKILNEGDTSIFACLVMEAK